MPRTLLRHPQSEGGEGLILAADASRCAPGRLRLSYTLAGAVGDVVIPPPSAPERTDELWRRTCFEAFVRTGEGAYYEFNLSPSTRWAAYRFSDYREGMAAAEVTPGPISQHHAAHSYTLSVELDLSRLPDLLAGEPWLLALTAVLEHAQGSRSYWALRHAPGKPDFHHPDSFALELPAPA